jgi:alkylation response protein AidB-like acyl-CoA dehydrogenase
MSTQQDVAAPARQAPAEPGTLFDITPSDEQRLLTKAVRDFALTEIRPAAPDADVERTTPGALFDGAAEFEIAAIGVPESLGGVYSERAAVSSVLVAEALAEGDLGIALALLAPAGVATAIGLFGSSEQQSTYLPGFVSESPTVAAVAIHEPHALFNALDLKTVAARTDDGYTLNGVKALVPRAAEGELFIVGAQLDGTPALFVVESSNAGLATEDDPGMGLRPAATGKLVLNDVKVPAGALLGEEPESAYRQVIALGRIGWAALATGTGEAVLQYVKEYVNDRVAFGAPISHRQSVAFMVANIAIELDGLRLSTYRAAALAETGKPFAREAALARQLTTKYGMQIGSDGVQLLGGHGFVKGHPVERWYRDLRAAGIIEGALVI